MTRSPFLLFFLCAGYTWTAGNECPPVQPPDRGTVSCLLKNDTVRCTPRPLPGTIAHFRCHEHYRMEGQRTSRCLFNGSWTSSPPGCLPDLIIADCGRRSSSVGLIVHGVVTTPGAFPWHVAIYHYLDGAYEYWCGGSLISELAVITAAHCLWHVPPEKLILAFGKFNRGFDAEENSVQKIKVKRLEKLESYQDASGNYNGDLAVVFLEEPVRFGHFSSPICLDLDQELVDRQLAEGSLGVAVGWGLTENDTFSDHLRMLKLPVMSDKRCITQQEGNFKKFVTYTSFCAGFGNGSGVCNGDSGGGLAFFDKDSGRWYLQGVVSVSPRRPGTSYCDPRYFTVFTKVNMFSKWLRSLRFLEESGEKVKVHPVKEGIPDEKRPRDVYAFIRKYFGNQVEDSKGKIFPFPHSKKMLTVAGIL